MKVSVVIPTYNDQGTIAAAVESALAQQFEGGFEVIVVNDGSTDGTRAELGKFRDRIRVIDQANRGVSAARNAGIRAAAGEYIALLDGDDTWTVDKLAKTVPMLDKNPACVAVSSNVIGIDGAGREVWLYVSPEFQHSPTLDEMLEWPWPYLPSAIVIRRDTLLTIGGFSEEFKPQHWGCEDTFILLLLRELGEIMYAPELLVRHRVREIGGHYANRLHSRSFDADSAEAFNDFERRFEANIILARLAREHFGARGDKIGEWAIDRTADELVTVGLIAMHEGNPGFAQRCYRASLRHRPLTFKTWLRLGWAFLPSELSRWLSPMLAPWIQRSLSGPPFSELQDRPQ